MGSSFSNSEVVAIIEGQSLPYRRDPGWLDNRRGDSGCFGLVPLVFLWIKAGQTGFCGN
jgi:hypothetical protein